MIPVFHLNEKSSFNISSSLFRSRSLLKDLIVPLIRLLQTNLLKFKATTNINNIIRDHIQGES